MNGDANGLTTCGTCTVSFITNASGTAANYTLSASTFSNAANGPSLSFAATPSGGNLTGGADAYTVYDAGTVSVTINNVPTSAPYGNGSSSNSIASALAGSLTNGTLVNATANGNVISITSKNTGAASNYSLSMGNNSTAGFSPVSFSASAQGGTLTGGAGATSGPVYIVSLGYAPNSNVLTANDSVNGNGTYGYDDFNRLVASNQNSGQQTYSYLYDRFNNRWQQNAPFGGHQFLASFTGANNRLDNVSHDAAGNVTQDPTTGATYTFDGENRVTQVNGGAVTYTYDADGQRVEKNVGGVKTDYIYDVSGHAIAEINSSGTVTRQELFAAGRHLGTYTNNTTYFSHTDWLGTERVRSDMTGAACETIQSLPFGDGQTTSGTCGDPSTRHFTGKERDAETGLDYFGARYYLDGSGRFITPDWADEPESIPYASLNSPQSLNLYGYVGNNPAGMKDDDGHKADCTSTTTTGPDGKIVVNTVCTVTPDPPTWKDEFSAGWDVLSMKVADDMLKERELKHDVGCLINPTFSCKVDKFLDRFGPFMLVGEIREPEMLPPGLMRMRLLSQAKDVDLRNAIDKLFRENSSFQDGGTAAAVEYERATGRPVGGKFHSIKAQDTIRFLDRMINSGRLSAADTAIAEKLRNDLQEALTKTK